MHGSRAGLSKEVPTSACKGHVSSDGLLTGGALLSSLTRGFIFRGPMLWDTNLFIGFGLLGLKKTSIR